MIKKQPRLLRVKAAVRRGASPHREQGVKNVERLDHQTAESGGRAAGSSAEERRQPGESLSEVRLASAAKTEK